MSAQSPSFQFSLNIYIPHRYLVRFYITVSIYSIIKSSKVYVSSIQDIKYFIGSTFILITFSVDSLPHLSDGSEGQFPVLWLDSLFWLRSSAQPLPLHHWGHSDTTEKNVGSERAVRRVVYMTNIVVNERMTICSHLIALPAVAVNQLIFLLLVWKLVHGYEIKYA